MNSLSISSPLKKPSVKRLATIDFFRGFAIFLMTFFHGFHHIFDSSWFQEDPSRIFNYPKILVALLALLIFLGTWNTFFLLVSSIVTSFGFAKNAQKGGNLSQLLFKRILTGIGLLIADHLVEGWGYYGYLGQSFRSGNWGATDVIWQAFFTIHTLKIIAWSLMITSVINYFLLRNDGFRKLKRNLLIYLSLTIIILVCTQFVHNFIDSMYTGWPSLSARVSDPSFIRWLAVLLSGELEPIFPVLSTGLIGSMIALVIAQPRPPKSLYRITFLASGIFILVGLLLHYTIQPMSLYSRPTMSNYLFKLGGQLALLMTVFRLVEYRGRAEMFANRRVVKFFRTWSMIALSVFALELFDLLPKWSLTLIFRNSLGFNFFDRIFGFDQLHWALLSSLYALVWYIILVELWKRTNFFFSLEWFLLRFQSIASREISPRLNVEYMFTRIEWINFVEDNQNLPTTHVEEISPSKTD